MVKHNRGALPISPSLSLDGIFIAILSSAPGVALAATAAAILIRAAMRAWQSETPNRLLRTAAGLGGAVAIFVLVITGWNLLTSPGDVDAVMSELMAEEGLEEVETITGRDGMDAMLGGIAVGANMAELRNAATEEAARTAARRLASSLEEVGLQDEEIADIIRDAGADMNPAAAAAAAAVAAEMDRGEPSSPETAPDTTTRSRDSLAVAYAGAVSEADSGRTAPLGTQLGLVLAADTIAELVDETEDLGEDVRELETENERLEDDLAAAREGGIMAFLSAFVEDMGLELGWAALYFTACLALGNGRTPGKMLTRVRVVRLDGRKMTWWSSFERCGGYAAGLATGLLGYFQVYWDPNRQAVHDKIVGTVVVRMSPESAKAISHVNVETGSVENAT